MNPIIIVPNNIEEITLTIEEFKKYIKDAYAGGYADAKSLQQDNKHATINSHPIIQYGNGKSASWLEDHY